MCLWTWSRWWSTGSTIDWLELHVGGGLGRESSMRLVRERERERERSNDGLCSQPVKGGDKG
jgi:hypothetical protein